MRRWIKDKRSVLLCFFFWLQIAMQMDGLMIHQNNRNETPAYTRLGQVIRPSRRQELA